MGMIVCSNKILFTKTGLESYSSLALGIIEQT